MHLDHLETWTLDTLEEWMDASQPIQLNAATREHIARSRQYLEDKIQRHGKPIYGINTGFGSLCNTRIEAKDMRQLQLNLVRSHACGAGERVSPELVRLMLLLKAKGLSHGHSGVRPVVVEGLLNLLNRDILPVVYNQGSLGASGDLAPLAHLSLGLIGEGEVIYRGELTSTAKAFEAEGLSPVILQEKEGLALLNGTQYMSALASYALIQSRRMFRWADTIASLSLEAYDGRIEPFSPEIQDVRPHPGQALVASNLRTLLEGSDLIQREKSHVQDPYSFRCIPQVHGASRDAWNYVHQVVRCEINSVTDNPTIFPHQDSIISAGNFHGQPLALALDFLCIAMAEIGSISERRIYKLMGGERDLPAFLTPGAGLNSGFMIPQYTAASLVSRNKQLCTPSSVDSIDSSNGQEDHVSMGANAANRALHVLRNLQEILGIELLAACQALDFRRPARSSSTLEEIHTAFRQRVAFQTEDTLLQPLMAEAANFLGKQRPPSTID